MKFKSSLLYGMVTYPIRAWHKGVYNFVLSIPVMVVVLTVGILFALFVDFMVAVEGE